MTFSSPLNFECLLDEALQRHFSSTDGETPPHLAESIRYSLLSPGKRIRPRLLLACAEMLGLSEKEALPAALALEMIHCFTLIHDDLPCMDDDDFRRGLPSNHKKFGESVALLAGDALMALAVDVFLDSPLSGTPLISGLRRLTWAMGPRGVIGGQAGESLLGSHSTLEHLQKMHRQKTGALFSAALLIPKDFSGISDSSPAGSAIVQFADILGQAFQIADDFEDAVDEDEHEPTSVLYYTSQAEAGRVILNSLNAASEQLCSQWGAKALSLKAIADEVIHKTESAMATKT